MAERWVCSFDGRAGGRARAVFATSDQAMQFAERHAQSTASLRGPLTWDHVHAPAAVLRTPLGTYLVAPLGEDDAPATASGSPPRAPEVAADAAAPTRTGRWRWRTA